MFGDEFFGCYEELVFGIVVMFGGGVVCYEVVFCVVELVIKWIVRRVMVRKRVFRSLGLLKWN